MTQQVKLVPIKVNKTDEDYRQVEVYLTDTNNPVAVLYLASFEPEIQALLLQGQIVKGEFNIK